MTAATTPAVPADLEAGLKRLNQRLCRSPEATSGDLVLATTGDFDVATDS